MTTQEFLIELRRLDVDLWLEGDRVRCSAPPDVLTAERRAELARRKVEIEALLKAARAGSPGSIVPIETGGSRLPFYAIPGHNGDVFCFVRLARCLGTDRAFYGLQPPGLDEGTSPVATIEDLAAHFVRELLTHQPEALHSWEAIARRPDGVRDGPAASEPWDASAGTRPVRDHVAAVAAAGQTVPAPHCRNGPNDCAAPARLRRSQAAIGY